MEYDGKRFNTSTFHAKGTKTLIFGLLGLRLKYILKA